jgi:hypothetical protein
MAQVKLDPQGIRDLLRSQEVLRDLERRARNIASAAGEGMEVDAEIGKNRARASVRTATLEARIAEASDRTLTKSLDAGRR